MSFVPNSGSKLPSFTTGSGQLAPILFISGDVAFQQYGATKKYANQCPNCKSPINQLLAWNSFNSYYYLAPCPVCGRFIEYMDNTGHLASLSIITSNKTTPLDVDEDVWDRY